LAEGAQVCDRCHAPVAAGPPAGSTSFSAPPPPYATPPPPLPPPPASPWAGGGPSYQTPGYPAPGYGYGGGYPPPPSRRTNGLAIASLVSSIAGLATCGIGSIVGVVLGHIAVGQVKRSGEEGRGLAIAGLAVGYGVLALVLLYILFLVIIASADSS
jgi:hypothetical protein